MSTIEKVSNQPAEHVPVELLHFPKLPEFKAPVWPNTYVLVFQDLFDKQHPYKQCVYVPASGAVQWGGKKFPVISPNNSGGPAGSFITFSPASLEYVTMFIPSVNLGDTLAQPFQTIAIFTTDHVHILLSVPVGPAQSYNWTAAQGTAYL
jgi:hypothetical protein